MVRLKFFKVLFEETLVRVLRACKKNFLFGFSSRQVENVHWKCMCAAHWCIIKMNKNKNKISLRNHELVRKKTKWRVKGK